MAIYFYRVEDEFGFLSNFAPYGFYWGNTYWKTGEHFYQSRKFQCPTLIQKIHDANTPLQAAIIAHENSGTVKSDWEIRKDDQMYMAIKLKFSQNTDIRNRLLATRYQELIEFSPDDTYWGCGLTKDGHNKLGKLLMKYRDMDVDNLSVLVGGDCENTILSF